MIPSSPFQLVLGALLVLPGLMSLHGMGSAAALQASQRTVFNVILADGGGLDAQTVRTLRALVVSELRRLGHAVNEDPSLESVVPLTPETRAQLEKSGGRTLVLRVMGRLGAKVPLSLEELGKESDALSSTSLTAGSIEECDVVIPRLVEAILGQKRIEQTARMASVTTEESRAFNKRPGEGRFIIGMLNPLFSGNGQNSTMGLSLGYLFEAEHWQVGVEGLSVHSGDTGIDSLVFVHGAWIPFSGQFSPYFGGGLGYLHVQENDVSMGNGMAFKVTGGCEMFRLHRVRVQVGVDLYFPGSRKADGNDTYGYGYTRTTNVSAQSSYPVLHVKVAF